MDDKIEKYLYKEVDGEMVATVNPVWKIHIQNVKYDFYLNQSSIPKDYWDLDFSDVAMGTNKDVVDKCEEYCNSLGNKTVKKSLYLYGENSSGKTTAMCSIGKCCIKRGLKIKFILSSDLLSLLQKTSGYSVNSDLENEKSNLESCDVLLIDELFDSTKSIIWKGESKNLIVAEWDSFIRHMISNNKKIICTSNILPARISSEYSKSLYELVDRNFEVLQFTESVKEYRKKKIMG